MRHRIKKIPTLKHLLHSDKSTYVDKKVSSSSRPNFTFPRNTASLNPVVTGFARLSLARGAADGFLGKVKLGSWNLVVPSCVSTALLLVLGMMMIFPVGMSGVEKASAATTVPDPNFSIQLSMGETLNTTEELESGVVGYISNNFTVSTTSTASYSIYLSPDTTNGYSNKLIGRDHKQEIAGVGNNVTVGVDFANNTWGYGLSNTNDTTVQNNTLTYSTIPDGSTPIKTINNPDDGNDTYKLVFAAKINNEKPVDHYQSQAVLSVMASPKMVINLDSINYMQEMTSEICADTSENTSKQLKDIRDNKTYWVTKIGNDCWMTQNLDLDLSTSKTLTPSDSNLTANWTPIENTQTSDQPNFGVTNNNIKSWDPGYKYFANGTTQTNSNEALAKDTTGQINAHYLQGNYYSWVAAMAGNTTGNTNESSICPKGWQLPLSNNGTNAKTFQALTNALGATSGTNTSYSGDAKLLAAPDYFVRGGCVADTSFIASGNVGNYWSSTPDSTSTSSAYSLRFDSTYVIPSDSNGRYFGYSVRCVAQ